MTSPERSNDQSPAVSQRSAISEDWLATVVGLALIVLIISGVITKGILQ